MMKDLRIAVAEEGEDSFLDALIKAFRFHDYRRYPSINAKAGAKYLKGLTLETLARNGAQGWFAYQGEVPVGFAAVSPLDWDSAYFGLRMARLSIFVASNQSAQVQAIADKLLIAALKAASHNGVQHMSLRVDVEDIGLVHALEKHGFRLMDTLVAFAFHEGKNHLPEISLIYDLRLYRPDDYEAVLDIAAVCFKGYPNRFTVDPHLPRDRSQAFYIEWAKNCCKEIMADEILIAERKGRVIGFLAYRCNPELERHTDVRIMGSGLGGCYPLRHNAFLELMKMLTIRGLAKGDAIDIETQLFNMATIKFCQKLDYSYVRAKHSFHRWLDV